jgi:hypothetical protein
MAHSIALPERTGLSMESRDSQSCESSLWPSLHVGLLESYDPRLARVHDDDCHERRWNLNWRTRCYRRDIDEEALVLFNHNVIDDLQQPDVSHKVQCTGVHSSC